MLFIRLSPPERVQHFPAQAAQAAQAGQRATSNEQHHIGQHKELAQGTPHFVVEICDQRKVTRQRIGGARGR